MPTSHGPDPPRATPTTPRPPPELSFTRLPGLYASPWTAPLSGHSPSRNPAHFPERNPLPGTYPSPGRPLPGRVTRHRALTPPTPRAPGPAPIGSPGSSDACEHRAMKLRSGKPVSSHPKERPAPLASSLSRLIPLSTYSQGGLPASAPLLTDGQANSSIAPTRCLALCHWARQPAPSCPQPPYDPPPHRGARVPDAPPAAPGTSHSTGTNTRGARPPRDAAFECTRSRSRYAPRPALARATLPPQQRPTTRQSGTTPDTCPGNAFSRATRSRARTGTTPSTHPPKHPQQKHPTARQVRPHTRHLSQQRLQPSNPIQE